MDPSKGFTVTPHIGLVGETHQTVETAHLASAVGSGGLDVFSTPSLVALMEQAARRAVEHLLDAGETTVGVRVDVRHLAATPPGLVVRARAELVEIVQGRRLVFKVEAFDDHEKIGEGTHERAIIDAARLLARANAKRTPPAGSPAPSLATDTPSPPQPGQPSD
jgi:predicted thioesterase